MQLTISGRVAAHTQSQSGMIAKIRGNVTATSGVKINLSVRIIAFSVNVSLESA